MRLLLARLLERLYKEAMPSRQSEHEDRVLHLSERALISAARGLAMDTVRINIQEVHCR